MIAAAFESLLKNNDDALPDAKSKTTKPNEIDARIAAAASVTGLLSVAESNPGMSRKQSLKVSNKL